MLRRIKIKLFGIPVLSLMLQETDDVDEESAESLSTTTTDGAILLGTAVGFGTPWSVEYYDEEA